jgi:hypothetical protein
MDLFTEKIHGKILFDPDDLTKKHQQQSSWKKHVIALIDEPDLCGYHRWYIEKRYNLKLAEPIRGPHFTIVNDRLSDHKNSSEEIYQSVQNEWNDKIIEIQYEFAPFTDGTHWWLRARSNEATQLRMLLGLSQKTLLGISYNNW